MLFFYCRHVNWKFWFWPVRAAIRNTLHLFEAMGEIVHLLAWLMETDSISASLCQRNTHNRTYDSMKITISFPSETNLSNATSKESTSCSWKDHKSTSIDVETVPAASCKQCPEKLIAPSIHFCRAKERAINDSIKCLFAVRPWQHTDVVYLSTWAAINMRNFAIAIHVSAIA